MEGEQKIELLIANPTIPYRVTIMKYVQSKSNSIKTDKREKWLFNQKHGIRQKRDRLGQSGDIQQELLPILRQSTKGIKIN